MNKQHNKFTSCWNPQRSEPLNSYQPLRTVTTDTQQPNIKRANNNLTYSLNGTDGIDDDNHKNPCLTYSYGPKSHVWDNGESLYITNYLNGNNTSCIHRLMTNCTVYHLNSFPKYSRTDPHTSSKCNEPQYIQPDHKTNGTLHHNIYHNHHSHCTLIDTDANTGYSHGGSNDLFSDTISIQEDATRITYNNYLFHNPDVEVDDSTDDDHNDDQDDGNQHIDNDDDTLDDDSVWQFQEITAHHRVPTDNPQYQRNTYTVRILWNTGELTDESLCSFGRDTSIECAIYARRHGLLNKPGWRRFRQIHNRNELRHVIVRQTPTFNNLFMILKLFLMYLMSFKIMYTNITTTAFHFEQNNKTTIGIRLIFQHHDEHQVGINDYNAVHTSQNKSAIINNQSHDLTNGKDTIITDIMKITNNNFRDVCIFNNLGTDYYHTLDDTNPQFGPKSHHVVQPQINKINCHNSLLPNNMITHGNILSHAIFNNTKRHFAIVARTDPDIIPSFQLYRNTSFFPYKRDDHTFDLLFTHL